jgi:hypothetical protein
MRGHMCTRQHGVTSQKTIGIRVYLNYIKVYIFVQASATILVLAAFISNIFKAMFTISSKNPEILK